MSTRSLHPFFDATSFYRLATRQSVWEDGGEQRTREFFVARAREALHRDWAAGPAPRDVQVWGHGPALLDPAVHDFLARGRAEVTAVRTRGGVATRSAVTTTRPPSRVSQPTPALLLLDPIDQAALPEPQRTPGLFTGAGESQPAPIETFGVHLTQLSPGRLVVVLIVADDVLWRLATLLMRREPEQESDAVSLLGEVLRAETLAGSTDEDALRRAFQVSTTLACAPALIGKSNQAGEYQVQVPLGRPCPGLEPWTWLVACVAPEL